MQTKRELRRIVQDRLGNMTGRSEKSEAVWCNLTGLACFQTALAQNVPVMCYLDCKEEVQTTRFLPEIISRIPVIIPYCVPGNVLQLFRFRDVTELEPHHWGILEPKPELREMPECRTDPKELGLIIMPGLAFDLQGGRLGRGKGYYDRFLTTVPTTVTRIALAFDCQVVKHVPCSRHDQPVDWVVTESRTICCQR